MNVIGIDPGKNGAFALLNDGRLVGVYDMPCVDVATKKTKLEFGENGTVKKLAVTHRAVDPLGVLTLLQTLQRHPTSDTTLFIALERVGGMPGQSGMFSFGRSYGIVETAAHALGIPIQSVEPATWKLAMGCSASKSTSCAKAAQAFPNFAGAFARGKDADKAEAALIALYAYNKHLAAS